MRWMLLLLGLVCLAHAQAREVTIEQYTGASSTPDLVVARTAPAQDWTAVDAIRTQAQPSWWRLTLAPGDDDGAHWVLALRQAFDAQFVVHLPPDYRGQLVSTFDLSWHQIGSRHRLALQLLPEFATAPVYLQLIGGRLQPVRVAAQPLDEYLARDLDRVRFSSMMLCAILMLALVAAVYAVALRRRVLLLFCVWLLCFFVYIAVGNGEFTWMWPEPTVLRHAMRLRFVALGIGSIAVFGFAIGFLDLRRHCRGSHGPWRC